MLSVLLCYHSLLYSLAAGSLHSLELGWQLARPGDPPVSASHHAGVRYRRPCLTFYMVPGDWNPGIHTCILRDFYPLNYQPSPLPLFEFKLYMIVWLVLCTFTGHLLPIVCLGEPEK